MGFVWPWFNQSQYQASKGGVHMTSFWLCFLEMLEMVKSNIQANRSPVAVPVTAFIIEFQPQKMSTNLFCSQETTQLTGV